MAILETIREHIEATPGVCGGRPRIAGHRIRVMDVAVLAEDRGLTPDEIVSAYPSLTLADVHAALAYYFDHREQIREALEEDRQLAEELAARSPSAVEAKLGEGPAQPGGS